jgi:hypothetical protein
MRPISTETANMMFFFLGTGQRAVTRENLHAVSGKRLLHVANGGSLGPAQPPVQSEQGVLSKE